MTPDDDTIGWVCARCETRVPAETKPDACFTCRGPGAWLRVVLTEGEDGVGVVFEADE